MATSNMTVAIVGAGITGLSTAFHLAEAGVGRIVIVDKGKVGSGSSNKSGAVNTMLMPTETGTRARSITMDIFESLSGILDDYSFHQSGCLFILTEAEYEAGEEQRQMHRRVGADFEVLRRRDMESRYPALTIRDDEYCVFDRRGGWNEPDTYIRAMHAKVVDMGVEIREDEPVEEFVREGDRMTGVRLSGDSGDLVADAVVCTVNAWANSLLAGVGQLVPARNYVHERFVTTPFERLPEIPATNDNAAAIYYRPTEDNRLLFGAHNAESVEVRMPGIDFDYSSLELAPEPAQLILEAVKDRLPAMRGVQLDEHRIGLISLTADGLPNIGPLAALPGLYLGTNFCSGGFGYHAVAGLLLSEFIVKGHTRIDATEFSPDRFADFETESFLEGERNYHDVRRH